MIARSSIVRARSATAIRRRKRRGSLGGAECRLEAGEIVERPTEADEQPRRDKPENNNDNSEKEQGDEHGVNVRALKRGSLDAIVSMAEPGLSICDSGVEAGSLTPLVFDHQHAPKLGEAVGRVVEGVEDDSPLVDGEGEQEYPFDDCAFEAVCELVSADSLDERELRGGGVGDGDGQRASWRQRRCQPEYALSTQSVRNAPRQPCGGRAANPG